MRLVPSSGSSCSVSRESGASPGTGTGGRTEDLRKLIILGVPRLELVTGGLSRKVVRLALKALLDNL